MTNTYYLLKYGFNPEIEVGQKSFVPKTTISGEDYKKAFIDSLKDCDYIAYSGGLDSDAIYQTLEKKPQKITIERINIYHLSEIYSKYKLSLPLPDKLNQWYEIFIQVQNHSLITGLYHDNLNYEYINWRDIIKEKNWCNIYLKKFETFTTDELKLLGYEHEENIPIINRVSEFLDYYLSLSWQRHSAVFELAKQMNVDLYSPYLNDIYLNALNQISQCDRLNKKYFRENIFNNDVPKNGFFIGKEFTSNFTEYETEFPWMTKWQRYRYYAVMEYEKYQNIL